MHVIENSAIAFTVILSRTARYSANGSGRIEFMNQTFNDDEIQALRDLYTFMETSISACDDPEASIYLSFDQLDTNSNDYITIIPDTLLEGINLNFSNNVVDNNFVRVVVSCELIPVALRQETVVINSDD